MLIGVGTTFTIVVNVRTIGAVLIGPGELGLCALERPAGVGSCDAATNGAGCKLAGSAPVALLDTGFVARARAWCDCCLRGEPVAAGVVEVAVGAGAGAASVTAVPVVPGSEETCAPVAALRARRSSERGAEVRRTPARRRPPSRVRSVERRGRVSSPGVPPVDASGELEVARVRARPERVAVRRLPCPDLARRCGASAVVGTLVVVVTVGAAPSTGVVVTVVAVVVVGGEVLTVPVVARVGVTVCGRPVARRGDLAAPRCSRVGRMPTAAVDTGATWKRRNVRTVAVARSARRRGGFVGWLVLAIARVRSASRGLLPRVLDRLGERRQDREDTVHA
jgi:hypothetical protein